MIGSWYNTVACSSVRLSVCLSVTLCIVALRVNVHCTGIKVVPACF